MHCREKMPTKATQCGMKATLSHIAGRLLPLSGSCGKKEGVGGERKIPPPSAKAHFLASIVKSRSERCGCDTPFYAKRCGCFLLKIRNSFAANPFVAMGLVWLGESLSSTTKVGVLVG